MANITFAVRGNQFTPRYSSISTYAPYASTAPYLPVIASGSQTGLIGGSYIDMFVGSTQRRAVIYKGSKNVSTNPALSILMRCSFEDNSALQGMFLLSGPYGVQTAPMLVYMFFSGGSLNIGINDDHGTNLISNQSMGSFSPVAGRFYDIVFTMTGDTTANGVKVYVDGTLLGTATLGQAVQNPRNQELCTAVVMGGITYDVGATSLYVNEFVIWDDVIDPTNVLLTTGNGSLSGQSRTAFVQAASFQGDFSSDPGIANVRSGVNYFIDGEALTGTLSGNSTDPGVENVLSGVNYEINGTPLVGTYVCPASVDPGVKNVLNGVTYTINGNVLYGQFVVPNTAAVIKPTKGSADFNIIRDAFISQIMAVTGLSQNNVIMEEGESQNNPRPKKPYIAMKVLTAADKSGDDDKRNVPDADGNPTTVWNSGGVRKMNVEFNCYGNTHEEAYNILSLWQTGLDLENIQANLRIAGIAVWTIGTVADLSQLLNTGYEGRAHLESTFGIAMNIQSDLGSMETVEVKGTISTEAGVVQTDQTVELED